MIEKQLTEARHGEAAGVSVYVTAFSSSSSSSSSSDASNAERRVEVLDAGTRLQLQSSEGEGAVLLDSTYDRVFVVGDGHDDGDNDVYRTTLGGEGSFHLPQQLCAGYNCTVVSCGAGHVSEPSSFLLGPPNEGSVGGEDNSEANQRSTAGLLPRLAKDIFDQLRSNNDAAALAGNVPMEYTIRCSAVEVCGDRMRDLLHAPSVVHLHRHTGAVGNCAALSCVSSRDVVQIAQRASAVRLCSRRNSDAGAASSMVVQITLEQYNPQSEESLQSRLLVVELETLGGASVAILQRHVRETVERQAVQPSSVGLSPSNPLDPTLRQLLSQSLGGNAHTCIFLHIGDGQSSAAEPVLQFGAACRQLRNQPVRNVVGDRWQSTHERVEALQYQLDCFQQLAGALADECHRLRHRPGGANHLVDRKLWSFIEEIQHRAANPGTDGHRSQGLYFSSETREEQQVRRDIMKLRSGLRRTEKERDDAISTLRQLESEIAIVTNELHFLQEQQKTQDSMERLASENAALKQRNYELENRLRTSLFRESEAVVFLRQYRKFYTRLLRQQAAKGSGTVNDIIFGTPGAPPDLEQLIDLDQFMVESGLLEVDEVGLDTPTKMNRPSQEAILRSTDLAVRADASAMDQEGIATPSPTDLVAHSVPLSIVKRHESGETTEARQKLFQTPSGRYVELREALLEKEIQELSELCHKLESQLKDEQDVSSVLKGDNTSSASSEAEAQALRKAIERREKDINAVIWKMNELHIAGKAFREMAESREPHIAAIEGSLAKVLSDFRECTIDSSTLEAKYRDEIQQLRSKVATDVEPTWHVLGSTKSAPTLESRLIIPFTSAAPTSLSVEESASLLDRYVCTGSAHAVEAGTQTDPLQFGSVDEAPGILGYSYARDAPSSREIPRATSSLTPDDFLFMDEDSFSYCNETQCANGAILDAHGVEEAAQMLASSTTHSESAARQQNDRVLGTRQPINPILGTRQHSNPMLGSRQQSNRSLGSHSHHITTSNPRTTATQNTAFLNRSLSQSRVEVSNQTTHAGAVPKTVSSVNSNSSSNATIVRRSSLAHVESRSSTTPSEDVVAMAAMASTSDLMTASRSEGVDAVDATGNSNASLLPKRSEYSVSSVANAKVDVQQSNQSRTPSLSTFMGNFRKKASDNQPEEDEQSSTPEFMKLFKKIGFKKSEEVIETQGAAAVRELTRTAYGEHAVETIRSEKGSAEVLTQYSSTTAKKWVPRKKKDDDSDSDDSFARKFLGATYDSDSESESGSVPTMEPESSSGLQKTSDLQQGSLEDETNCKSPKQAVVSESTSSETAVTTSTVKSEGGDSDSEVKTPPWKKKDAAPPPLPQSIGSPWKAKPSATSSSWRVQPIDSAAEKEPSRPSAPLKANDSDSDSEEDEKARIASVPQAPQRAVSRPATDDSETDSDEENQRSLVWKRKELSPPPRPAAVRVEGSESGSDSDEDEKPPTPPWKKKNAAPPPPPPAPAFFSNSKVATEHSNVRVAPVPIDAKVHSSGPRPGVSTRATDVDSDDDNSDDSDDDDSNNCSSVSKKRASQGRAAPAVVKRDEDSSGSDDSDSDDEPRRRAPVQPSIATANRAKSVAPTAENTVQDGDDDSSSDDSSTEHPIETPLAAPSLTAPSQTGTSTASTFVGAAPATRPSDSKNDESSSDGDASSGDEDSPVRGVRTSTVAVLKPPAPPIVKDASSEEDSSDGEASPRPPPKPPAAAALRNVPLPSSPADSSDETDSSEDEAEKTSKTKTAHPASLPLAPAALPVRTQAQDDETETEEASDEDDAPRAPVPTRSMNASIDLNDGYESDEESSEDETPKSAPKSLQSSPPQPSPVVKASPPTFTDDDDSDEEPPRSTSKADPPSSQQEMSAAEDETGSGTDGEYDDDSGFVMAVGKPTGFEPTRQVPDFGAQVTPSVTQAANHMGGWSDSKREKAKFVIRNGQLVKSGAGCDSSVVSEASVASSVATLTSPTRKPKRGSGSSPAAPAAVGKTKFVIRDGKLVKDDGDHGSGSPQADEGRGRDTTKPSVSDKKVLKMEPSSPRKKSGSKGDSSAKLTTSALFVIKDGKLVKSPGAIPPLTAPSAAPTGPPAAHGPASAAKAPAFSIVNGKLVKVDDAPPSPPSKSRKSDRKDKKDKEKKQEKKHKKKKVKS